MQSDMVTILKNGEKHIVLLSSELNGDREVWREFTTTETVQEIKDYISSTYPDVTFAYNT